MNDITERCWGMLRAHRALLIWGLWMAAWTLIVGGFVADDLRYMLLGLFVGLAALLPVAWAAVEETVERVTINHDDMALAFLREQQRREGPRGL